MFRALSSTLLVFLFTLSACTKEEESPSNDDGDNDPSTTTFTCLIDGIEFSANSFLIDDVTATGSGIYQRRASGSYISGGDTMTVSITLLSPTEDGFEVGANFDSANGEDEKRCYGNVWNSSDGDVSVEPGGDEPPATATLSAVDSELEVFSGSFEFEYYDSQTETDRTVSEGVFSNINYD